MINTVIALPYEIARLPWVVVGNQLADRLAETSRPRVVLDRAIGSADKLAGALLRNPEIAERGADRLARSEKLVLADRLEEQAATRREQAEGVAATAERDAAQKREAARSRVVSGLEEAGAAEARGKEQAQARAAKAAAAKKTAAAKRAAKRTASVEQRKASVEATAEATKKAAQTKARAELGDVRETKVQAAEARADAEQLGDLVDASKQERQRD
jgi:hypothetical protein